MKFRIKVAEDPAVFSDEDVKLTFNSSIGPIEIYARIHLARFWHAGMMIGLDQQEPYRAVDEIDFKAIVPE